MLWLGWATFFFFLYSSFLYKLIINWIEYMWTVTHAIFIVRFLRYTHGKAKNIVFFYLMVLTFPISNSFDLRIQCYARSFSFLSFFFHILYIYILYLSFWWVFIGLMRAADTKPEFLDILRYFDAYHLSYHLNQNQDRVHSTRLALFSSYIWIHNENSKDFQKRI